MAIFCISIKSLSIFKLQSAVGVVKSNICYIPAGKTNVADNFLTSLWQVKLRHRRTYVEIEI